MADPHRLSKAEAPSTATQVTYWVMLVSLILAVVAMGAWWISAGIPITASTTFILMFATIGLAITVFQLLILGIKRLVRGRVERSGSEGD